MNLRDVKRLAKSYMYQHKLIQKGWKLRLFNSKRDFGLCDFNNKEIKLSIDFLKINPKKEIKDTVLHEIAHALDSIERGFSDHSIHWKKIAKKLGCKFENYKSDIVSPKPNFKLICNNCKEELFYYREMKFKSELFCTYCLKQNKGVFDNSFKLFKFYPC